MSRPRIPADEVSLSRELFEVLGEDRGTRAWEMVLEMGRVLREDRLAGDCIEKNRIPRYYRDLYGVNNLYRYQFSGGMRACYTLQRVEAGICAVILELFMDHKAYDRRFGYSGD